PTTTSKMASTWAPIWTPNCPWQRYGKGQWTALQCAAVCQTVATAPIGPTQTKVGLSIVPCSSKDKQPAANLITTNLFLFVFPLAPSSGHSQMPLPIIATFPVDTQHRLTTIAPIA